MDVENSCTFVLAVQSVFFCLLLGFAVELFTNYKEVWNYSWQNVFRAQELLKQKRVEREEKEKKEQLEREKQRRVHGKEMIQIRQKYGENLL